VNRFDDGTTEGAQAAAMLLIFLLIVGLVMYHSPAESQAPTWQGARIDRDAVLTGARLCVGETGFRDHETCAAMIGVIARRAARRDVCFSRMATLYSRALRSPQPGRRWVPLLHDAPEPPQFWAGASWGFYRPQFAAMIAHVRSVLAGDVGDPCPSAEHFGGHMDSHRMRSGWVRVCDDIDTTRPVQQFWSRP